MSKVIHTDAAPAAIGPYVQAREVNGFLYTSGQIPVNAVDGSIAPDIVAQTKQSLANVKHIVEAAGYSVKDIFKCLVFIKDLNQFVAMNEVYQKFFEENGCESFPIRSCVEVARLPKDVLVEIEVVATKS